MQPPLSASTLISLSWSCRLEKPGRDASLPRIDPQDEESPLYWGNVLEPIVAWHYSKRSSNRVRRINAVLQHPNRKTAWMLANIDREVIGADDVQILECKPPASTVLAYGRRVCPNMCSCRSCIS